MIMRDSTDLSVAFMLKEYEITEHLRSVIIGEVEHRSSLYFKMFAVIIAAMPFGSLLASASLSADGLIMFFMLLIVSLFALLLFGFLCLDRVLEGHISIIRYTRGLNRARRFFVDADPSVSEYVSLPCCDDVPEFGTFGFSALRLLNVGVTSMVAILNALNCFLLCCSISFFIKLKTQLPMLSSEMVMLLGASLLLTIIYYAWLRKICEKRIQQARESVDVKFSSEGLSR